MTHQPKPIAPYHRYYYEGFRGQSSAPDPFTLDGLPDELCSAIENGTHPIPAVRKVLNSTALFAVLIALVNRDWSDGALQALMTSDHAIANLSRHQHARWRQAMINQARTRNDIIQSELKCPRVKVPGTGVTVGSKFIQPVYVRDDTKQPYPWFDNIRYLLYANLGVERIRHDMACGEIVIDHDHSVLSGAPTLEALWAMISEGPDGITIDPTRFCKYLTEIADRSRFDLFYEQRVELVLEGRAEITRREADGEVLGLPLIEQVISTVLKLDQTDVTAASSRMLWRDFIAYQFVPPTQHRAVRPQGMVILSGYGGVGKSLFIYVMANGDTDDKEPRFGRDLCYAQFDFSKMDERIRFYRAGSSSLMAEVKEGLGFSRGDADDNKAEVDRGEFKFDPKFLNKQVTYFRRYLMVLTTENFNPLNWKHAWRRWLISRVDDSLEFQKLKADGTPEKFKVDIQWLVSNYAVLSALAYDLLAWEGNLRLSDSDLNAIRKDNARHVATENWEIQLLGDLEPVIEDVKGGWFHDSELAKWLAMRNRRPSNQQLAETLRKFGFTRTSQKSHGYIEGKRILHRDWIGPGLTVESYLTNGQQYYWDEERGLGHEPAFKPGSSRNNPLGGKKHTNGNGSGKTDEKQGSSTEDDGLPF